MHTDNLYRPPGPALQPYMSPGSVIPPACNIQNPRTKHAPQQPRASAPGHGVTCPRDTRRKSNSASSVLRARRQSGRRGFQRRDARTRGGREERGPSSAEHRAPDMAPDRYAITRTASNIQIYSSRRNWPRGQGDGGLGKHNGAFGDALRVPTHHKRTFPFSHQHPFVSSRTCASGSAVPEL